MNNSCYYVGSQCVSDVLPVKENVLQDLENTCIRSLLHLC